MGGGLMQLVAYGAQDIYLTGNPQITFFKVVYRRHTNFSMESIQQAFNGTADFGRKVTCTLGRNGDLVHRLYLVVEIPKVTGANSQNFRWLNWLGHVLVKNMEIEIGGQKIDKHYGDWLHIWNELTQTSGHQSGYANMVGNVPALTQPITSTSASTPALKLYVPLQFWFCRNPGLSLPIIALQYHEVKINIEFRSKSECYWANGHSGPGSFTTASIWADYIYLDTEERRRFSQISHEYLIEQLQFTGSESVDSSSNKLSLSFNHPCKEIVWVCQLDKAVSSSDTLNYGGRQWFNYTDTLDVSYFSGTPSDPLGGGMGTAAVQMGNFPYSLPYSSVFSGVPNAGAGNNTGLSEGVNSANLTFTDLLGMTAAAPHGGNEAVAQAWASATPVLDAGENPTLTAKLQLNGLDRFEEREGRYFNIVQPYQHHTNVPATGINVYSFSLRPEEHQPSGTCNFSRIDSATLHLTLSSKITNSNTAKVRIYATNYNILRIMSGMGGLAYSN
jgi:hypothetical protein